MYYILNSKQSTEDVQYKYLKSSGREICSKMSKFDTSEKVYKMQNQDLENLNSHL